MNGVRYYGRRVSEDHFEGREGKVVKALNRVRLFSERLTEVSVALYEAKKQGASVKKTLNRLIEEGVSQPLEIATRPPVDLSTRSEPDDPNSKGRFYEGRDYSARVGRATGLEQKRAEVRGQAELYDDGTLSIVPREYKRRNRQLRYSKVPLINESFGGLNEERMEN